MIRSMTGYGNHVSQIDSKTITVELRSVNSKFLDLILKLPGAYRDKDLELRSLFTRDLERGKVDFTLSIDSAEQVKKTIIDKSLFAAYHKELESLSKELSIDHPDYFNTILRLPDVLVTEKSELNDSEWQAILATVHKALGEFQKFRDQEGNALAKDLTSRIKNIETLLSKVEVFEPQRLESVRQRLSTSLEEFIEANNVDRNRFEQELIFYIEKLDISEEKVRLRSHCDFFIQTMNEPGNSGKKLSFLSQEIGREINTIGSKANHAGIQQIIVEMKDELEKIKEQLMNVL